MSKLLPRSSNKIVWRHFCLVKPPFTAFAAAKAGLRALAQGMAREFSPQGIHVVHTIIDGVIDGDRARKQFPAYVETKDEAGLLQLDAIAPLFFLRN